MKDEEDFSGWEVIDKPVEDYSDWELIDKYHKNFSGEDEVLPAQGVSPSEAQATEQPSPLDEFQKSIGYTIPKSTTFTDAGEGFRHGVEKYTHGFLDLLNKLIPVLPENFGDYRRERLRSYEDAQQRSPRATALGNIAGEIGATAPLVAATGGWGRGLLGGAAEGALTGAGTQFIAHPEDERSRLENALKGLLFGGVGGGVLGGLPAIPGAVKALSNKGGAEGLRHFLLGKNKNVAGAEKLYKGIEKQLEAAGKTKDLGTRYNKIRWEEISEAIPDDSAGNLAGVREIKRLVEKGTYKDIDQAQSKLSAWKRELERRAAKGANNTKAYNAVRNAEKHLHGSLYDRFMEFNPMLAAQYQKANELYAKGMGQDQTARSVIGEVTPLAKVLGSFQIFSKLLKGK